MMTNGATHSCHLHTSPWAWERERKTQREWERQRDFGEREGGREMKNRGSEKEEREKAYVFRRQIILKNLVKINSKTDRAKGRKEPLPKGRMLLDVCGMCARAGCTITNGRHLLSIMWVICSQRPRLTPGDGWPQGTQDRLRVHRHQRQLPWKQRRAHVQERCHGR